MNLHWYIQFQSLSPQDLFWFSLFLNQWLPSPPVRNQASVIFHTFTYLINPPLERQYLLHPFPCPPYSDSPRVFRLWLLSLGHPLQGHPSHLVWVPTLIPCCASMWTHSRVTQSLTWSHCDSLLCPHPTMCVCPQCCAPLIAFRTELSRKGMLRKGRERKRREEKRKEGKGKERKRRQGKGNKGEGMGKREKWRTLCSFWSQWNWWMLVDFLQAQSTDQSNIFYSMLIVLR